MAHDQRRPVRPLGRGGIEEPADGLADQRLVARPMDVTLRERRHDGFLRCTLNLHHYSRHARARRGHRRLSAQSKPKTCMAGTSPAMDRACVATNLFAAPLHPPYQIIEVDLELLGLADR